MEPKLATLAKHQECDNLPGNLRNEDFHGRFTKTSQKNFTTSTISFKILSAGTSTVCSAIRLSRQTHHLDGFFQIMWHLHSNTRATEYSLTHGRGLAHSAHKSFREKLQRGAPTHHLIGVTQTCDNLPRGWWNEDFHELFSIPLTTVAHAEPGKSRKHVTKLLGDIWKGGLHDLCTNLLNKEFSCGGPNLATSTISFQNLHHRHIDGSLCNPTAAPNSPPQGLYSKSTLAALQSSFESLDSTHHADPKVP